MLRIDKKRIIKYGAVIGLLVFLYTIGLFGPVEGFVAGSLDPLTEKLYSLSHGLRTAYNKQTNKQDLAAEIGLLRERMNELTAENTRFKIIEEENKNLREHLGFLTQNEYRYVMANVISRGDIADMSGRTETIIIDKGLKDGIYSGLGVVSSEGIIVGRVVDAKDNISQVYLTNNGKCKLAAAVLSSAKTSGVVEGELGLTIKMNFIPQNEEIKTEDIIITSGLEEMIPRGLVIGRVLEVIKESNEVWQTAVIEPMADPEDLIIVSVLLP
ncbi:MAG: rod shape-determining protein MreC [Candidatus Falkowbacteria bacterium]